MKPTTRLLYAFMLGWIQSVSAAPLNRIEQAATPVPFAKIEIANSAGPQKLNVHGVIELGAQTDGLNPASDRTVVVIGSRLTVLEPGSLLSSGKSSKVWTYQNPKDPFLNKLILQQKGDSFWQFELGAAAAEGNQEFHLRVGNDWGGVDLATCRSLLTFEQSLDINHQTQATIGGAGGTLQAIDAAGVMIRLDVPAGALNQDVLIKATPLLSSPLVAATNELHPGVRFEPEGLQFAIPAKLTLDFARTNKRVTTTDSIFLITSPMTMLPLFGTVDTVENKLTAVLYHFSTPQPGHGQDAFMDLKTWADSVLSSTDNLTLSEIQLLASFAAEQQRLGCTENCLDLGLLAQRVEESINALVTNECPLDTDHPSDQGLQRYLQLEVIAQQFGADIAFIRPCLESILGGLINRDGNAAIADPSDANRQRMVSLIQTAQGLGFSNLETLALQKLDTAMRNLAARILGQVQQASGTPNEAAATQQARTELEDALLFVTTTGADVLRVDPALAADLQAAIDSLSGLRVVIDLAAGQTCLNGNDGGYFFRPGTQPPFSQYLSACGGQLDVKLRRVGTNAVEWDVNADQLDEQFMQAIFVLTITVPRAGRIDVDINPNWAASAPDKYPESVLGQYYRLAAIVSIAPSSDLIEYDYTHFLGSVTGTRNVSGTFRVVLGLFGNNNAANAGRGRLMTLTFH